MHSRHSVTFTDVSGLGLCKWCHQIKQIPAPRFQFWRLPSKLGQVGVIFLQGIMETQISTASCYKQVTNHVNQVTSNVDWEGSWSWRTWRFPQACVFGGNKTVLYTASSQIRLMDKFLHQFERFETHTQNLRKWDVDVDYIIHRLTCSSPSTKCSKQSMVSSSWPQQ